MTLRRPTWLANPQTLIEWLHSRWPEGMVRDYHRGSQIQGFAPRLPVSLAITHVCGYSLVRDHLTDLHKNYCFRRTGAPGINIRILGFHLWANPFQLPNAGRPQCSLEEREHMFLHLEEASEFACTASGCSTRLVKPNPHQPWKAGKDLALSLSSQRIYL